MSQDLLPSIDAIVSVRGERGFLVATSKQGRPLIITAAHCLPELPPAHPVSHTGERTYVNLLGPLGEKARIWAECLFVDPVADIAVLAPCDDHTLLEEAEAYEAFVAGRPTVRLGALRRRRSRGWVLTLQNTWNACTIEMGGSLAKTITLVDAKIEGGMSGSPILDARGNAVGLVSVGGAAEEHGQPSVMTLPGWLLVDLVPRVTWPAFLTAPRRAVQHTAAKLIRQLRHQIRRIREVSEDDPSHR